MTRAGGDLWSVSEAGQYLGVGRTKVYALLAEEELTRVWVGGRAWVLAASVRAYLDRQVSAATPPRGLPLGGQVWPPGTIGALEDGEGSLPEDPADPEGQG